MDKKLAAEIADLVGKVAYAYSRASTKFSPSDMEVQLMQKLESIKFDANGTVTSSSEPEVTKKDLNDTELRLAAMVGDLNAKFTNANEDSTAKLSALIAEEHANRVEDLNEAKESVYGRINFVAKGFDDFKIALTEKEAKANADAASATKEPLTVEIYKGYEVDKDGVKHTYSRAKLPTSKRPLTDSGFDAYVCYDDATKSDAFTVIAPGTVAQVPLGISGIIPKGYEIQLRPRSGESRDGHIAVFGTVDETYRGVFKANIANISSEPFVVNEGDRICQLVLAEVTHAKWVLKEGRIDTNTDRGTSGFGDSGKR